MRRTYSEVDGKGGCIATLGCSEYNHRFGGTSWRIESEPSLIDQPTLLITLDMNDPLISDIRQAAIREVALCSYINSDAWVGRQTYSFDANNRIIRDIDIECQPRLAMPASVVLPNPLLEQPLRLRPMSNDEVPVDEPSYWSACDTFVGGTSFLRIGGPPLWLQDPLDPTCVCGSACDYIAAVGYESSKCQSGLVPGRPFFFGEGGLYFFLCKREMHFTVLSQAT